MMVLSEEDVLRQMEMRVKTERIVGTLCKVRHPHMLYNAMKHLDVWNDGEYISNPYSHLSKDLMDNMTVDLFRIFIEYTHHWMPKWSKQELELINDACRRFKYQITVHDSRVSFRVSY